MASSMGRPAVFRNKVPENNVHGRLTLEGQRYFDLARKTLARMIDWKPERIGDSDVIEFLARGEKNTRAYLASGKVSGKQQRPDAG